MSVQASLYSVRRGAAADQLTVEAVWSQNGNAPFGEGYSHIVTVTLGGTPYLLATDGTSGAVSAFRVQNNSITPVASQIDLGGTWDALEPFVIGNQTHLMAYAKTGKFAFFPLKDDLSADAPYQYARNHDPGMTNGFTTVYPIVMFGAVYFMGYGSDTGKVALYSLAVTATSPSGQPPLVADYVWLHQWAKNWTRFAFFQLGGENFFLKTNTGVLNVNIDHVFDDPTRRSVEVGTNLQDKLPNAATLDICRSFTLGNGDPYFVAYTKTGQANFYRIWSNCQGWTQQASLAAVSGSTQIVPIASGDNGLLLFYGTVA